MPNRKASTKPAAIVAISGVSWPGIPVSLRLIAYILHAEGISTGIFVEIRRN
jgi:hypothetical protein